MQSPVQVRFRAAAARWRPDAAPAALHGKAANTKKPPDLCRCGGLEMERSAQGLTGSGFLANAAHQPAAVTNLPPKAEQGPAASPALPV